MLFKPPICIYIASHDGKCLHGIRKFGIDEQVNIPMGFEQKASYFWAKCFLWKTYEEKEISL